jgi:IclR family transcriptional regulator, KDG regulon repressor
LAIHLDAKATATVVPAVDRAVELLRALSAAGKPLTLSELGERTATSRSTAFNTLAALQQHGFVEKNPRFKTYRLGLALYELGNAYLAQVSLTPAFMECAEELVAACGETVKLAMRDGREVIYLATQEGQQAVRSVALVGARLPAHCTGVGKILLAQLSNTELDELYVGYDFPVRSPHSLRELTKLKAELELARKTGIAYDREESSLGIHCVAAPILDNVNKVVAAMSVGVPNHRLTPGRLDELTQLVRKAAQRLSRRLGWLERDGVAWGKGV